MSDDAAQWVSLREFARRRGVSLGAVQKAIESGRVTAVQRDGRGRLCGVEVVAASAQWAGNTDPDQAARRLGVMRAGDSHTSASDGHGEALAGVVASIRNGGNGATPVAVGEGGTAPKSAVDGDRAVPVPVGPQYNNQGAPDLFGAGHEAAVPTYGREPPRLPATAPSDPDDPAAGSDPHNPAAGSDPHGYLAARAMRERFQARQAELEWLRAVGRVADVAAVERAIESRLRGLRDQLLTIADRESAVLAAERDPAVVHATITAAIRAVLQSVATAAIAESVAPAIVAAAPVADEVATA